MMHTTTVAKINILAYKRKKGQWPCVQYFEACFKLPKRINTFKSKRLG